MFLSTPYAFINLRHIGNDPFDYHKYGEDPPFQEMGEHATVWKILCDEALKYDNDLVENWKDALDVLLVFVSVDIFPCRCAF